MAYQMASIPVTLNYLEAFFGCLKSF